MVDVWFSLHTVERSVPCSPCSLVDNEDPWSNGPQNLWFLRIIWVNSLPVQFLLKAESQSCSREMHTPLHSIPLSFAAGCFLKEDGHVVAPAVLLASKCVPSHNRIQEETLWQSSLKPLHPRLSGKPWMVKAGSAELQVGLGWREVSQCSWSFRGIWGPGRWLRRGGLGDPEGLARVWLNHCWTRNLHLLNLWFMIFILIDVTKFPSRSLHQFSFSQQEWECLFPHSLLSYQISEFCPLKSEKQFKMCISFIMKDAINIFKIDY